jgi:DNA replication and repair protein RecF
VYVANVSLHQFSNLANQKICFSPTLNFIAGNNGQGKSNLLEAIAFLSTAKSFRTNRSEELIRWGTNSAAVHADVDTAQGLMSLGLALAGGRRTAYIDHQAAATAEDFVGKLTAVAFSPRDLILVQGGPEERRSFLDKNIVAVDGHYFKAAGAYRRALRSKAALLRQQSVSDRALDAWDATMAGPAAALSNKRSSFVAQLKEKAREIHARFAPQDGELAVELKTNVPQAEGKDAANVVLEHMRQCRQRELQQRAALIGPHRDDLLILLGGKNARAFASQGQCRSVVLALVLASIELIETERKEAPVVLLDDVDSELDENRRARFFQMLLAQRRQVLITGTCFKDLCASEEINKMKIVGGEIKEAT